MIKTALKIRTYGDPCLRVKAEEVDHVGPAELMLIKAMIYTISQKETDIGLAAPQVGISKQIFVIDLGEGPTVFVNPKVSHLEGQEDMEEGCLSFPGLSFKVRRPKKMVVDYIDEHNKKRHMVCDGFLTRVILHEYDHLNGKLIIDYASDQEKQQQSVQIDQLLDLAKCKTEIS